VPWGKKAEFVVRNGTGKSVQKGYNVAPCPNFEGQEFVIDRAIYSKDALYPGKIAEVSNPAGLRDYCVVHLVVNPVQYNPVRKEIEIYKSIDIKLKYVPDPNAPGLTRIPSSNPPAVWKHMYETHIVNYDFVCNTSTTTTRSVYVHVLMITPPEFESALSDLVDYHENRGSNVVVLDLDYIEQAYPRPTLEESIRACIADYYWDSSIELFSVLLVGDHEQTPAYKTTLQDPYAGDHYYAALDYPDDPYRDIGIGRLSGTSASQVSFLVDKIVTYRTNPPSGDWTSRHLFVAHKGSYDGTPYKQVKNQIKDDSVNWQSDPEIVRCFGDNTGDILGWNSNVKYMINSEHCGTVNYRGHGGPSRWANWSALDEDFNTWRDVESLSNGNYTPAVFNIACDTGIFYNMDECFCEAWVRQGFDYDEYDGGAFGALGAVCGTWGNANDYFDRRLYKYIFEYRWKIGDAIMHAMLDTQDYYYSGCSVTAYTWFGDPYIFIRSLPVQAAPAKPKVAKADRLLPIYPNPFNPETWIPYSLKKTSEVVIEIHNINGELVRSLQLGLKPAGVYTSKTSAAHWDGRSSLGEKVASGVYFCTLKVNDQKIDTKRLILLK